MKIIYVDSNKYALNQMQKDISQIVPNAQLHCFEHPELAVAFANTEGCDVLMTEVELWTEKFGGVKLAKEIQELDPQVNVIFVTVCDEYEVTAKLFGLRFSGFISKPWKSDELAAAFRFTNPHSMKVEK
ncbi:MAG: response regulator [Lachnospiraceae bacterium]|nr:response regulator [Lachnospiraceae bacterium]